MIPSPFPHLADFETRHGLEAGSISATIRHYGDGGSFARLERGELTLEQFCAPFSREYSDFHGVAVTPEQMWELAEALGGRRNELKPLKEVKEVLSRLKNAGVKIAVITNNFRFDDGKTVLPTEPLDVDVVRDRRERGEGGREKERDTHTLRKSFWIEYQNKYSNDN